MKIIAQPKAGAQGAAEREKPLDMALCTVIPKGGMFSVQLPAIDWEPGLQAIFSFDYDGKGQPKDTALPATLRVVPVLEQIDSHCMDASDGMITEDCVLNFEKGRDIDIQSDASIQLSAQEMGKLNAFLERWGKR